MNLKQIYEFNNIDEISLFHCDSIYTNFQDKIFTPIIKYAPNNLVLEIKTQEYKSIGSIIELIDSRSNNSQNEKGNLLLKLKSIVNRDIKVFAEYFFIENNFDINLNSIFIPDEIFNESEISFSNLSDSFEHLRYIYYPIMGNPNESKDDFHEIVEDNIVENISKPVYKNKFPKLELDILKLIKTDTDKTILLGIFGFEAFLILIGYFIFKYYDLFSNKFTPISLIFIIIIVCVILDLWILFSKRSPAKIILFDKNRIEENNEINKIKNLNKTFEKNLSTSDYSNKNGISVAYLNPILKYQNNIVHENKACILVDDFVVGKLNSKVDLLIDNILIDDMHSRIVRRENQFFISDLQSKHATFVNETKLKKGEELLLENGDIVSFAGLKYKFTIS